MSDSFSSAQCYNMPTGSLASKVLTSTSAGVEEKIRILIIDDFMAFAQGLASLLNQQDDLEVVEVTQDTRIGLQLMEKYKPAIITIDISMAGTSPFEIAKRAKVLSPKTKVIFFVRDVTDNNLERGLEAGSYGFISKTEGIEGISNAIKQVSRGEKFFSEDLKQRVITKNSYDPKSNNYAPRRSLLSPREIEVLCCVARGMKAKSIGKTLHITAKTVERHKSNIMAKLGLHSQVDLAIYAIKEGYVSP